MTLRRIPRDQLPESYRAKVDAALQIAGDARFLEVAANAPHMLSWFLESFYSQIFFGGIVSVRIKELVRLRLSQLHGCAT